jgi:hypothetical protein
MLEAEALHSVGQLDINTEVIRVKLELVAFRERLVFLNIHRERGDSSGNLQLPVPVSIRRRLKRYDRI